MNRDMGWRTTAVGVLIVALVTLGAWGSQFGLGMKLHTDEALDLTTTYLTAEGTFDYFAIDGGILWDSIDSLLSGEGLVNVFCRGKLRVPFADFLFPYGGAGMSSTFTLTPFQPIWLIEAVGGVELSLSANGIPISAFVEMCWISPAEQIAFGDGLLFFGLRVDLYSWTAEGEQPSVESPAPEAEQEPEPCCEDPRVLRRWRQND
jgi:hypothetical protein